MLTAAKRSDIAPDAPFDTELLDRLMDEAGIDVLLATSKHNVQYLLGGHRSIFFDYMDAIGMSRYLPVFVYPKGTPDRAGYVGYRLERYQREVKPFWVSDAQTTSRGCIDAMEKALDYVRRPGSKPRRIGVETAFLPLDAATTLRSAFPDSEIVDAVAVLERLRARKTPAELKLLREASDRVINSMLAVIEKHGPGATKQELVDALRREETGRDLVFEYCLITAGTNVNRAPSEQKWQQGDILSLNSGGNYRGYIGDVCRMAILGEPDAELEDLLGEIDAIQQAGFKAIKPGAMGGDIYAAAQPLLRKSNNHNHLDFLAHGMGLVSHEVPHLTGTGPVPYAATDADRPLEAGMVVSVETTLHHPRRGFIKLEDTVAVSEAGHEVYGDRARGWNRGGGAAAPR